MLSPDYLLALDVVSDAAHIELLPTQVTRSLSGLDFVGMNACARGASQLRSAEPSVWSLPISARGPGALMRWLALPDLELRHEFALAIDVFLQGSARMPSRQ
ncbi:hypothetical protein [Paraburkholderia sp. D1E]|uniref:hypothetical protein n=1 Tax=Paraburkholderia sp. D1E TaxID=3461398 RepID=UPI004045F642